MLPMVQTGFRFLHTAEKHVKGRPAAPEGLWSGVCVDVIDLGIVQTA